jgi:hypothetical protein
MDMVQCHLLGVGLPVAKNAVAKVLFCHKRPLEHLWTFATTAISRSAQGSALDDGYKEDLPGESRYAGEWEPIDWDVVGGL